MPAAGLPLPQTPLRERLNRRGFAAAKLLKYYVASEQTFNQKAIQFTQMNAEQLLDKSYHEMRWRILSLAADFDRIERAENGNTVLTRDPRAADLRKALSIVLEQQHNRAEQVQSLLSDHTPAPK